MNKKTKRANKYEEKVKFDGTPDELLKILINPKKKDKPKKK